MAFACIRLLSGRGGLLGGLAVPAEDAGRHELAQLVTHHVFRDVDRDELVAVVHRERVADELRQHRRAPRPRLEHALLAAAVHPLDLPHQRVDDVRTFANRTGHERSDAPSYFERRRTMSWSLSLRLRVLRPFVILPHGEHGCRPPELLPSPPPIGWSTGFMATPRTLGYLPSQRLRPALP